MSTENVKYPRFFKEMHSETVSKIFYNRELTA